VPAFAPNIDPTPRSTADIARQTAANEPDTAVFRLKPLFYDECIEENHGHERSAATPWKQSAWRTKPQLLAACKPALARSNTTHNTSPDFNRP